MEFLQGPAKSTLSTSCTVHVVGVLGSGHRYIYSYIIGIRV